MCYMHNTLIYTSIINIYSPKISLTLIQHFFFYIEMNKGQNGCESEEFWIKTHRTSRFTNIPKGIEQLTDKF